MRLQLILLVLLIVPFVSANNDVYCKEKNYTQDMIYVDSPYNLSGEIIVCSNITITSDKLLRFGSPTIMWFDYFGHKLDEIYNKVDWKLRFFSEEV